MPCHMDGRLGLPTISSGPLRLVQLGFFFPSQAKILLKELRAEGEVLSRLLPQVPGRGVPSLAGLLALAALFQFWLLGVRLRAGCGAGSTTLRSAEEIQSGWSRRSRAVSKVNVVAR